MGPCSWWTTASLAVQRADYLECAPWKLTVRIWADAFWIVNCSQCWTQWRSSCRAPTHAADAELDNWSPCNWLFYLCVLASSQFFPVNQGTWNRRKEEHAFAKTPGRLQSPKRARIRGEKGRPLRITKNCQKLGKEGGDCSGEKCDMAFPSIITSACNRPCHAKRNRFSLSSGSQPFAVRAPALLFNKCTIHDFISHASTYTTRGS